MSKTLQKRDSFWGRFDDLFESMDNMFDKFPDFPKITGYDIAKGKDVSVTTYKHDDQDVEIRTENGKTTIRVNGVEYAPVAKKGKKT